MNVITNDGLIEESVVKLQSRLILHCEVKGSECHKERIPIASGGFKGCNSDATQWNSDLLSDESRIMREF